MANIANELDRISQNSLRDLRYGYPSTAVWMGSDTDGETTICKRFNNLTYRNLLYLQAELMELEYQLREMDRAFWLSNTDAAFKWEALASQDDELSSGRIRLIHQISQKLETYQKALLRTRAVSDLPKPRNLSIDLFRKWFLSARGDDPVLQGKMSKLLSDADDLCVFYNHHGQDVLTRMLLKSGLFARAAKNDLESGNDQEAVFYASIESVQVTVSIINLLTAAGLLIGAMVGLRTVDADSTKVVIVCLLTLVFGCCMLLMSNARRAEVFAATAAYSAVLVVYISSGVSGKPS